LDITLDIPAEVVAEIKLPGINRIELGPARFSHTLRELA
jgi:hypothetical protein